MKLYVNDNSIVTIATVFKSLRNKGTVQDEKGMVLHCPCFKLLVRTWHKTRWAVENLLHYAWTNCGNPLEQVLGLGGRLTELRMSNSV